MSKLTSEKELDSIVSRGDDNIVDWQLSREFAELWLEDGILNGDYSENSTLWEIPIAIYTHKGDIKFYEFRIISGGKTVGAIVCAATKDFGCPVVYEGLKEGYADELTELYKTGKLTADQLPRIVDDGYPNVVAGVIKETRGVVNSFSGYIDLNSGNKVSENEINTIMSYEDVLSEYSEYIDESLTP